MEGKPGATQEVGGPRGESRKRAMTLVVARFGPSLFHSVRTLTTLCPTPTWQTPRGRDLENPTRSSPQRYRLPNANLRSPSTTKGDEHRRRAAHNTTSSPMPTCETLRRRRDMNTNVEQPYADLRNATTMSGDERRARQPTATGIPHHRGREPNVERSASVWNPETTKGAQRQGCETHVNESNVAPGTTC